MSHEWQTTSALHADVQMGPSSPFFGGSERTSFAVILDGFAGGHTQKEYSSPSRNLWNDE
jgi:hypothetical protein